jgi:hypothetical protein
VPTDRRDLPLSAASRRLRAQAKKPHRSVEEAPQHPGYLGPGRVSPGDTRGRLAQSARPPAPPPPPTRPPEPGVPGVRLLHLERTARYLGVSKWTVYDLVAAGTLPKVQLPLPEARDGRRQPRVRKTLFDLEDLDRLIQASKRNPDTMPG